MSVSDHSVLFKSKSGRHVGKLNNRDDEKEEKNRNRHKNRHDAFLKNRIIQSTPGKAIKEPNTETVKSQNDEQNKNVSRQKAFRDKFQQYLEKKASLKQGKTAPKPFLSAVAKGRFIDQTQQNRDQTTEKKKIKKVVPTIVTKNAPSKNARYSPINTRSKRLALLSPSQLPTPKRKVKNERKIVTKTSDALGKKPREIKTISKGVDVKPPSKMNVKKLIRQKDPKTTTITLPVSSQKAEKVITSTVVRPKNTMPSIKKPTKTSKIFDESISPVEEIREPKMDVKKSAKKAPADLNVSAEQKKIPENENFVRTPKNVDEGNSYYVSPYVTISRGSRTSYRKETEARNVKYALESRKSLDLNESIENRQHKEAANYFRLQVQRETDRLSSLMTNWQQYVEENEIPSEYKDLVNVAIGQTRLLTTSKFKQFSNLIGQCERKDGEQVVNPEDLEGFWSMVYLQVENCNQRFERLKTLKNNEWIDPDLNVVKEKKISKLSSMVSKKPKEKCVNSALSAMLKEARKKIRNETKENKAEGRSPMVRCVTPRRSTWVVEDCNGKTPTRGILKTPGSVRTKRMTLTFKTSPQVKLFVE